MIHKLKIEKRYLKSLLDGSKKAEIRLNDRYYNIGDLLSFSPHPKHTFKITHIHSGFGMQDEYVVLSVERMII